MNRFFEVLDSACAQTFLSESAQGEVEISLSEEQILLLAERILALPERIGSIFYFYYSFDMPISQIQGLLSCRHVENAIEFFTGRILRNIGLSEDLCVSPLSMRKACDISLKTYMELAKKEEQTSIPEYSKSFQKRINKLAPKAFKRSYSAVTKRIAVILLVITMSAVGTFTFSASAREWLMNLIVETFPQFSRFNISKSPEETPKVLEDYQISFMPEGFYRYDSLRTDNLLVVEYRNEAEGFVVLQQKRPNGTAFSLNTENAVLKQDTYEGVEYIYWSKDGQAYIVWEQEGYIFNIVTDLDMEIGFQIAKSIKREEI